MIESRRQFLVPFFQALEANGVRYCVLRNYDDLYGNDATDVDLVVSEYSRARFERCLHEAADQAGWYFVHAARYVNHSRVFWHPRGGFVRVDYETEVRWRFFTALTARQVLDGSQRHQEFFIPAPELESVILYIAAIWRGLMSDRYRGQLGRLYERCANKEKLRRTLVEAFGHVGVELAEFQAHTATAKFDPAFSWRVRRSLMITSHLGQQRLTTLATNFGADALRGLERLRHSAGMAVLFVSSHPERREFAELFQRINFLFPIKKNRLRESDLTTHEGRSSKWNLKSRWQFSRTLFKGGLFIDACRVSSDADLSGVVRQRVGRLHPTRTFVCTEDSAGRLCFGHVGTGFMISSRPGGRLSDQEFSEFFIRFLSAVLQRASDREDQPQPPGLFCVLVGLDGSGKTTLARNLCELVRDEPRLSGIRYFHWRPKTLRAIEFPLPEYREQARKAPTPPSAMNHLLSAARLIKNAVLINLAWWFRVRRLVRRGGLVLVDRYIYNYYLDPDSVKFSGPRWLLNLARHWFPHPDLVLKLEAPQAALLARKRELSEAEILRQVRALADLRPEAGHVARVDASQPAAEVAQSALREIRQRLDHH